MLPNLLSILQLMSDWLIARNSKLTAWDSSKWGNTRITIKVVIFVYSFSFHFQSFFSSFLYSRTAPIWLNWQKGHCSQKSHFWCLNGTSDTIFYFYIRYFFSHFGALIPWDWNPQQNWKPRGLNFYIKAPPHCLSWEEAEQWTYNVYHINMPKYTKS